MVLAIGLAILWVVGLGHHATPWLTWLDGLAAVCGLIIAFYASDDEDLARAPIALAAGLGLLWIIGLGAHGQRWLAWWTFGFACAYLALGLGAQRHKPFRTQAHPV
jgi:hypothetical protein